MALYVMRHAPTGLNKETAGPERIRGWGPAGLGPEGQQVAKDAAASLQVHKPSVVFTSDLPRAKQTAEIMAKQLGGVPVIPARELRTWNVGNLTGQLVSKAKPMLDELQNHKLTDKAPGGESYMDFYRRWGKVVQQLQHAAEGEDVLVVVHGRQVYSLPFVLAGKPPRGIPTHGAPDPGDILRVDGEKLRYAHQAGAAAAATA